MWKGCVVGAALAFFGCQRHEPVVGKLPPVPPGAAVGPIGVGACDEYLDRVQACAKLTAAARQAFAANSAAWKQAAAQPGAPAKAAEASCRAAAAAANTQLHDLGC